MINHLDPEEEGLEKKLSNEDWFTFSKYIEINYLKLSIISFKVLLTSLINSLELDVL